MPKIYDRWAGTTRTMLGFFLSFFGHVALIVAVYFFVYKTRLPHGEPQSIQVGATMVPGKGYQERAPALEARHRGMAKKAQVPGTALAANDGEGDATVYGAQGMGSPSLASDPRLIYEPNIERHYPKRAVRLGIEGRVILRLKIAKDGAVVDAMVVQGLEPILNKSAVMLVKNLRYRPATDDAGEMVEASIDHEVVFRLTRS